MADVGHEETEKLLKELEKEIAAEYRKANKEVAQKLSDYLAKTEVQRMQQMELLKAGKITQKEYNDWVVRHTLMGERWAEMRDVLARDYHHANEIALKIAKEKMPDVYALNMNFGTYNIEHDGKIDTGFTLYNHDTAEMLLKEQHQLMPAPSTRKAKQIAANKDMQWNEKHIQSAVLQGVLQGESPYNVAKRLQQVGQINYNNAVRYARTMTTSAQNEGRYNSYRRAKNLGVDLTIEWQATLDGRTRHEHRMMHGQRKEVDEPFEVDGFKILYPAQSEGAGSSDIPQSLIWNCRCTLLAWVKGFEGNTVKSSPKMGNMSFEEWQQANAKKATFQQNIRRIRQEITNSGGDITEEHLKKAGDYLAQEYRAMIDKNQKQYDKIAAPYENRYRDAEKVFKDYENEYRKKQSKLTPEEDKAARKRLSELGKEVVEKRDAFYAARKPYMLSQDEKAKWLANKIGEVRPVGTNGIDLTSHLLGRPSPDVKAVEYAYSLYPTDWIEKSVTKGDIRVSHANRGYYQRGRTADIVISASGAKSNATAIHELGHRFEDTVPGILKNERAYYQERTAGEKLVPMGKGFDSDEHTRKDKFIDKYMGKDYGTGREYELVSMGFQLAYTEPEKLAKDEDFQKWIYGQLLLN